MGDFHLPVGVIGGLRLVEGDDGVDQGEAVLTQARPADGDALPGGPAGRWQSNARAASEEERGPNGTDRRMVVKDIAGATGTVRCSRRLWALS
ncbi:hypothetical protein ACFYT4_33245 [Streptomyces sp. NPDC004609]|uniref:hypothetical protein n=1 Tax=Streptomyces sp. NPDC004609 TaxID=3364704 RepID=UPI00368931B0